MKVVVCIAVWNEEKKIGRVLERISRELVSDTVVVDDGSTDRTVAVAQAHGATILHHPPPRGVGGCIWQGIQYARARGADVIVFLAGNNKDAPEEIPRLLKPIQEDGVDLVQGSRYLPGGRHGGDMPWYRVIGTKYLHPAMFWLATGRWLTDTTNGFRAFRLAVTADPAINLDQPWLRRYELEPYLLYQVVTRGYRVAEVPVTKLYPPKQQGYTKMRPLIDWWGIVRPLLLLALHLKR